MGFRILFCAKRVQINASDLNIMLMALIGFVDKAN